MEITHKNTDPSGEVETGIKENTTLVFPLVQSNKSRVLGKIRYWWCWLVAAALLFIIGPPTLIILGLINRKMWLYPIARWGANLWLNACSAKISVSGGENLSKNISYVFASNHRSYLDTVALFFHTGHKMGLVAKKELLKIPIFGQGMHYVKIFAIDRTNPENARKSMEKARKVMESGFSFGVFAEGTRAMPGQLLPFKKGAFHLAIQTNAQIVPVVIKNTDWMMGKKTGVAFAGTIEMKLLSPIKTANKDVADVLNETRAAIANELNQVTVSASQL